MKGLCLQAGHNLLYFSRVQESNGEAETHQRGGYEAWQTSSARQSCFQQEPYSTTTNLRGVGWLSESQCA